MKQNNISRRDFFKLVGTLGTTAIFSSTFLGCSDSILYGNYISEEDLSEYELFKYYTDVKKNKEQAMLCKVTCYEKNKYKNIRVLTLNDNGYLTGQIIYQDNIKSMDEFMNLFLKKYHIITTEPALLSVHEKIGIKSRYSAEELNTMLKQIEKESNSNQKTKTLV